MSRSRNSRRGSKHVRGCPGCSQCDHNRPERQLPAPDPDRRSKGARQGVGVAADASGLDDWDEIVAARLTPAEIEQNRAEAAAELAALRREGRPGMARNPAGKRISSSNLNLRFYVGDGWTRDELSALLVRGEVRLAHPGDEHPYYVLAPGGAFDIPRLVRAASSVHRAFDDHPWETDEEYCRRMNW